MNCSAAKPHKCKKKKQNKLPAIPQRWLSDASAKLVVLFLGELNRQAEHLREFHSHSLDLSGDPTNERRNVFW